MRSTIRGKKRIWRTSTGNVENVEIWYTWKAFQLRPSARMFPVASVVASCFPLRKFFPSNSLTTAIPHCSLLNFSLSRLNSNQSQSSLVLLIIVLHFSWKKKVTIYFIYNNENKYHITILQQWYCNIYIQYICLYVYICKLIRKIISQWNKY